jgi:hemerythrin-like domain-containing protein
MAFKYSCTRILHDDHVATLALLTEAERMVLSRREGPPQIDQDYRRFIDRFCKALNVEVTSHFDFEEVSLLPVVADYGDVALCELLLEEHHVLLNVASDVVTQAQAGRDNGFTAEEWGKFRRLCGELIERLTSHIEKEERALLPALEEALTPETDTELAARHDLEV